jgi:hypothetical protein
MTRCPDCHQPLRRSDNGAGMSEGLPGGTVVLACTSCRKITIEGSGQWLPMTGDWRQGLRVVAGMTAEKKSIEKSIAEAAENDPRWDSYEIHEGRI